MLNSFQTGRISRFGRGGAILRSATPLEDEQIMRAARWSNWMDTSELEVTE